ncbi:MAG: hypothetical protein WA970_05940, partial [Gammaproteobacteria bacterium]
MWKNLLRYPIAALGGARSSLRFFHNLSAHGTLSIWKVTKTGGYQGSNPILRAARHSRNWKGGEAVEDSV